MMIASTNHLDQLDPGLSHRPSRFDRKYLFPFPSLEERTLYCEYWRHKLRNNTTIEFPELLCEAMAGIMNAFTFAYMKEAFIATLLTIAGKRTEDSEDENGRVGKTTLSTETQLPPIGGWSQLQSDSLTAMSAKDPTRDGQKTCEDDLEKYEIWREMVKQVKILRDDMAGEAVARRESESISGQPEGFNCDRRLVSEDESQGGGYASGRRGTTQQNVVLPYRGREPQEHASRGAGLCLRSGSSFGGLQFVPDC